jgi:hypothetical protein
MVKRRIDRRRRTPRLGVCLEGAPDSGIRAKGQSSGRRAASKEPRSFDRKGVGGRNPQDVRMAAGRRASERPIRSLFPVRGSTVHIASSTPRAWQTPRMIGLQGNQESSTGLRILRHLYGPYLACPQVMPSIAHSRAAAAPLHPPSWLGSGPDPADSGKHHSWTIPDNSPMMVALIPESRSAWLTAT